MSDKHTPTPWEVEPHAHASEYADIYCADNDSPLACDALLTDALHIVRCVNSHAALLAACRAALDDDKRFFGNLTAETKQQLEAAISEAE